MSSSQIFISYRRSDARADAGRLYDRLHARYPGRVFMDVGSLEPGVEWQDAIDKVLASTSASIVVIGPHWLDAADATGKRRLDDPEDTVRREVAAALVRHKYVFPVLVGDAALPTEGDLPKELKPLLRRNAVELTEQHFDAGVDKLERAIGQALGLRKRVFSLSFGAARITVALFSLIVVAYVARQVSNPRSSAPSTDVPNPAQLPAPVPSPEPGPVPAQPPAKEPAPPIKPPVPSPAGRAAPPEQARPPRSKPAPPPVTQSPASLIDKERAGILLALNRYQDAYRVKSVSQLRQVYPSLSREAGQRLERTFRDCRAFEVSFLNPQLALDPNDPTDATVRVRSTYTCQPKSAQAAQPATMQEVFVLRKLGEGWLISAAGTMGTVLQP